MNFNWISTNDFNIYNFIVQQMNNIILITNFDELIEFLLKLNIISEVKKLIYFNSFYFVFLIILRYDAL